LNIMFLWLAHIWFSALNIMFFWLAAHIVLSCVEVLANSNHKYMLDIFKSGISTS
jgi:hypothetical protein